MKIRPSAFAYIIAACALAWFAAGASVLLFR